MASLVGHTSRFAAILSVAAVLALTGCDDDTTVIACGDLEQA